MIAGQHGHCAPARDIVPAPSFLSCSRFWAALPPRSGTLCSIENVTPVPSGVDSSMSRIRLLFVLQSHSVLSSGIVARQFLQVTVRAHRYATVGFATQRGLKLVSQILSPTCPRSTCQHRPHRSQSGSTNCIGCGSNGSARYQRLPLGISRVQVRQFFARSPPALFAPMPGRATQDLLLVIHRHWPRRSKSHSS